MTAPINRTESPADRLFKFVKEARNIARNNSRVQVAVWGELLRCDQTDLRGLLAGIAEVYELGRV